MLAWDILCLGGWGSLTPEEKQQCSAFIAVFENDGWIILVFAFKRQDCEATFVYMKTELQTRCKGC